MTDIYTSDLAAFDAWLDGASLPETCVEILQNPALIAKWEDLQARYERAQEAAASTPDERGMGERSPLAALEDEARALLAEIEAYRSSWYVRALTPEDLQAIIEAHPIPEQPRFTAKVPSVQNNPTETQAKAFLGMYESYKIQRENWQAEHAEELQAFEDAVREANTGRGAEKVARALVRIEQDGAVVATGATAEQIVRMARKIGNAQTGKLLAAIDRVTENEPEVPAAFFSTGSGSDPE